MSTLSIRAQSAISTSYGTFEMEQQVTEKEFAQFEKAKNDLISINQNLGKDLIKEKSQDKRFSTMNEMTANAKKIHALQEKIDNSFVAVDKTNFLGLGTVEAMLTE